MAKRYLKVYSSENEYETKKNSELQNNHVVYIKDNKVIFKLGERHVQPSAPNLEYVDLGLTSGTLWAKYNFGAQKEGDYGLFFQWGDITRYTSDECQNGSKKFMVEDYPLYDSSTKKYKEYNETDNKTKLSDEDDVVKFYTDSNFTMPTKEQCDELIKNTYIDFKDINGIKHLKCSHKTDASRYILFPLVGCYENEFAIGTGANLTWSLDISESDKSKAKCISCLDKTNTVSVGDCDRSYGAQIHPVKTNN